jgi:hypothetical protein
MQLFARGFMLIKDVIANSDFMFALVVLRKRI